MRKKYKIIILLLTIIILLLLTSNWFLSPEAKNIFSAFVNNFDKGGKWEVYYSYISWGLIIALSAISSRIGFLVARKKGLNSWKWAKYCFWGTVLALLYLCFIEDGKQNIQKSNADKSL